MKGSLVVIAVLCVIAAAAEASSVRFVSADDGRNDKEKAHRSEVSEGTDPVIQKKVEDVVKKINDGQEELEKTVKSLDADRSSEGDSENAGEGLKKAASADKSKVHKRDVGRAMRQLAKRGMKRAQANERIVLSARKIIVKYLSLQKSVTSKISTSLIFAVDQLEPDQTEKDALIAALKTFQKDMEQAYDNTINSLGSQSADTFSDVQRKSVRADEMPALMNAMNQRNPLAVVIPLLINGISGAASIADLAKTFSGNRSDLPDLASIVEVIQRLLAAAGVPAMSDYM